MTSVRIIEKGQRRHVAFEFNSFCILFLFHSMLKSEGFYALLRFTQKLFLSISVRRAETSANDFLSVLNNRPLFFIALLVFLLFPFPLCCALIILSFPHRRPSAIIWVSFSSSLLLRFSHNSLNVFVLISCLFSPIAVYFLLASVLRFWILLFILGNYFFEFVVSADFPSALL